LQIALDATYSIGSGLTGVGVYSKEMVAGLSVAHPETTFRLCYRPHRYLRALAEDGPANCRRRVLWERRPLPGSVRVFHGLNQRLPANLRTRSVCTFHDLFVITGEYSSEDFRQRFAAQARDAAARADLIIAVSEFTATRVCELLKVEGSRVRVVHHGVRLPVSVAQQEREAVILHVGAIQRRKNVLRLVEAFEGCPRGWNLVLAGSTGYGAGEILERIGRSPRHGDIHVTGYVSSGELQRLLARARILAFPSLAEGFGLPLLEAMANGVAVLTSNSSALVEVAGDAALLVDPLATDSIREGLTQLMTSSSLRTELTQKGFRRVKRFSWEKAVAGTWSVYEELLG